MLEQERLHQKQRLKDLLIRDLQPEDVDHLLRYHDPGALESLLKQDHSVARVLALECGWTPKDVAILRNCSSIHDGRHLSGRELLGAVEELRREMKYPRPSWHPNAEYWEYALAADQGTYVAGGGWRFKRSTDESDLETAIRRGVETINNIDASRLERLFDFSARAGAK